MAKTIIRKIRMGRLKQNKKMKSLKEQLYKYVNNSTDPQINFDLGLEYEKIGQTAAALSFYLRCAELTDNKTLAYESLLKTHKCVATQTRRPVFEQEQLITALTHLPQRPEAYLLLSLWHSAREEWKVSNSYAIQGLELANLSLPPLNSDIGYAGHYALKFQKAFTCWWIGQRDLSLELWKELFKDIHLIPKDTYYQVILNNCKNFNIISEETFNSLTTEE